MYILVGRLVFLSVMLALPIAAQENGTPPSSGTVEKSSIYHIHGQVIVTGPNGAPGQNAPMVLQVKGGVGGNGSNGATGSGIQLAAGTGGGGTNQPGTGGAILIAAGDGGAGGTGNGGSITLQSGQSTCGELSCGLFGNIILAANYGNVGIFTANPSNTLEVGSGGTTLADAWTVRSSRRFKVNIQPLGGALEKIEQLQGVSYERKSDGKREIGVVAEEVDRIVPEVVSRDSRTQEVQGVDYSRLAALLIEAVKTQQAELRSQQTEIQHLKTQIAQLALNRQSR